MHYTKEDIKKLDRVRRLNIINSISGIKPANLIGTISKRGIENVAIFNSVVHIGSDPALVGFIMRPTGDVERNTYENIKATDSYTINHIHVSFVENAHYTSAKFDSDISEFEKCKLKPEYLDGFTAPYVGESQLKYGLQFVEEIPIKINGTILMIGEVQHLYLPDSSVAENGYIDLSTINDVGISGLNSYYSLKKFGQYPYARPNELPDFK